MTPRLASLLIALALPLVSVHAEEPAPAKDSQPSGWRGNGQGLNPDAAPPVEWSDEKNVKWIAELGTTGYASPVVAGGRAFVVCEPNEVSGINLADGKVLWTINLEAADLPEAEREKLEKRVAEAGNAAPTPVCDGRSVYVVLNSGLVASLDHAGKKNWTTVVSQELTLEHGRSASPILVGDKLLVQMAHLVALDAKNGKPLWEAKDAAATYGSPVAAKIGEVDVAVTPNGCLVRVADGKVLAKAIGVELTNTSPVVKDGVVYFAELEAKAVKLPDALKGDLADTKTLWEAELDGETFASPLVHDGLLYSMNNYGVLHVLDAATGKEVYTKETGIPVTAGGDKEANIYPSPTLAGKHILFSNDKGDLFVIEPGKEYKEVKRNALSSGAGGCPVPAGPRLLLRGEDCLYCVQE
ncbi:MAG: PQQ-like beta-propeller repeat protein [Planctomycetota bacterium]|nr:PQQ-like beta-propeller repeat protein [Planctomycetota bacterium]